MDDLILREDALEAIMINGGCGICLQRVLNIPDAEAIPIKWIENLRRDALKEGMNPDVIDGADIILWNWYNGRRKKH